MTSTTASAVIPTSLPRPGESVRGATPPAGRNDALRVGGDHTPASAGQEPLFEGDRRGLLWAEPLTDVALKGSYERWHTNGVYTGNSYLTLRRGDGSLVRLNPRSGFWGGGHSADDTIDELYSVVPRRF
ncbi:hypothetical protein [Amycolatopsis sp. MtRt-6]|uniref:hypothetical protein n=1 Tax=Amycolatopsis sp. MtRt-6 TaxID=2792782 RepID=UPI001A8D4F88|nr:hypothetical protein [Amycolatopsis sp. MtRt-6]